MKRILLLIGVLTCLAAVQIVFAQSNEGVILYEVKANLHRTLPKDRQEMKNMIPEFRTSQQQLVYNGNESLFKPVEEEDEDQEFGDEGGGVRMRFRQPNDELYSNQEKSQRISLREFMGKKYLIEDSLKINAWKFGTETKTILGYECRQATLFNEERKQTIVAWYTMALRPFLGPETFNTLPGAVLQIDINEGERTITAKKVEVRSLKKNELKAPEGGIKTTPVEFRKMMDEQMEKMRANGANIIIRN